MLKIDENNNVYLTRGDTAVIDVQIYNPDGSEHIMTNEERMIFTLRKMYDKGHPLIAKSYSAPVLYIYTYDTENLTFGDYHFDIYLKNINTNTIDTFIAEGKWTIGEEVHEFV